MRSVVTLGLILVVGACGSDDDDDSTPIQTSFTVGGTVVGLNGSQLVLRVGGSDQRILGGGAFAFYRQFEDGEDYEVTVRAHPVSPALTCTVTNGTGIVDGADVTDIVVTCANGRSAIGGTVSGLAGSGLLLQNNSIELVAVDEDGPFIIAIEVEDTTTYEVTVFTQPSHPDQTCVVAGGTGTVAGAAVTGVAVTCTTP
jgi:hypothetical protein